MFRPRTRRPLLALLPLLLIVPACSGPSDGGPEPGLPLPVAYPETVRVDHVDVYHGEEVADPYRWLEELDGPETAAWVEAQNAVSEPFLTGISTWDPLKRRLTELWNYERYRVPTSEGGRLFWRRNDGLQDQDVLWTAESLEAEPRVLVDPNGFSDDGTVSMSSYEPSPDGRLVAYSRSDGGSDWRTWHVLDVATGEDLADRLAGIKFSGVSWTPDASAFYYSRYPVGDDGAADDSRQVAAWRHTLGTPQEEDQLVFEVTDHPTRNPYATLTDDGRYLGLGIFDGYDSNAFYVRDLEGDGAVVRLLDDWDALYSFLGSEGSVFYFWTNRDAPKGRVVAIDLESPAPESWREVIPEGGDVLDDVSLVGGHLVAEFLRDARSRVAVHTLAGELVREVELPGIGSASGFEGHLDEPVTFYSFTSFTTAGEVWRYDVATGESELFRRAEVPGFDPEAYEVRQVFYDSADGTRVPMFVIHRQGLELDGSNPTLLYGYGGFDVSLTPAYSTRRVVWMEMGGVVAIPNLRGGGEYGEAWHLAGTKLQKQNVFDDFIAAAEWLVAEGYTSPEKLAIRGGSNGGLLVGAVLTQRPELFGATLPAVGVLDMLRYHTASANARQWSSDYGLSENEEEFAALRAYSPVHNTKPGACYPPTLITTADHDDRVVPWHSFKFAAALQHAQGCDHPILLRVETRAGHGAGKPTWMQIEDVANQLSFLTWALEVRQPVGGGGSS